MKINMPRGAGSGFAGKKVFLIAAIFTAAALGLWLLKARNNPETAVPQNSQQSQVKPAEPETVPAAAEEEKIYPVSLPALMQKEFDGRDLKLGKVLAETGQYTRYYITYKSGDLSISGIMNIPKGQAPEGGWPVLILNHGHIDTAVYTNGRGLRREQDYFAKNGFAVLHPDYRNHAQSDKDPDNETNIRLGYIEDVINSVYAVKNSGLQDINKEKIGMLGHSMGGGITQAVLVVKPELVSAAVLYAPVSLNARDSYERWTKTRPEVVEKIAKTHGSPESSPEFWDNISPLSFLKNITAPMQYHHGDADKDVPLEWSQNAQSLLQAAGKNVELFVYPGQPHELVPPSWDLFMSRSGQFFRDNL